MEVQSGKSREPAHQIDSRAGVGRTAGDEVGLALKGFHHVKDGIRVLGAEQGETNAVTELFHRRVTVVGLQGRRTGLGHYNLRAVQRNTTEPGLSLHDGATGAVTLIQRFGSALNLNIHFHILFLDGVYVHRGNRPPRFRRVKALAKGELEELV
jgi:hypothetical protein